MGTRYIKQKLYTFLNGKVQKTSKIRFCVVGLAATILQYVMTGRGTLNNSGMVLWFLIWVVVIWVRAIICALVISALLYEVSLSKIIKYEIYLDWERKN